MNNLDETPWIFARESLESALDTISTSNERTTFVVNDDHKLIGVITEGDALRAFKDWRIPAGSAMDVMVSTPTYFVEPRSDLELARIFCETGILLIPIVDANGLLRGSQSTRLAVANILAE
jgi:CBS domain-containing protein